MRHYVLLYILLLFGLVGAFFVAAKVLTTPVQIEVDMLAVNTIVKSVEQSWQDLQQLQQKDFAYRFFVLDKSGNLKYSSDSNLPDNLQSAIKQGFAMLDATDRGEVAGKVFIETDPSEQSELIKQKLAALTITTVILVVATSLLFLILLHHMIIRPFKKMERFAYKISTGSFNEAIPMKKNNAFGAFTEAFDVMRTSLLESKQKERQAELAKKELVASLSHDIKTPVTSIKLIAELLIASGATTAIQEKLLTIEQKADQIDKLMNDMLHSTLEELGELAVNATSESSEVLRQLFRNADPRGKVELKKISQCLIDVDVRRMEQVIGNVISNSYKYAGTEIQVFFIIQGEYLHAEISDFGTGAPHDEIELLCGKFYRGTNAVNSQKDGEGLGLYIAKLLMQKMGGELSVYNRADGFSVRLIIKLSK